jgi:hypothetical protein
MLKDANDMPDPKGFKVLKLEPVGDEPAPEVKQTVFTCQFDGKRFDTEEQLNKYIQANHADKIFKDELLEKELEKDKKVKGK